MTPPMPVAVHGGISFPLPVLSLPRLSAALYSLGVALPICLEKVRHKKLRL